MACALTRPLGRPGPVDVGDLALVAAHARVVRRALAGVLRPHALDRRRRGADQLPVARARAAQRDGLRAATGLEAHVAGRCRRSSGSRPTRPTMRVPELLVVRASPVSNSSWMTTSPVGRTTSRAHSAVRSTCGQQRQRRVGQLREVARGRREVAPRGRAARAGETSLRVWSIHGNDASIVAAVSRTPGRISRAKARVGGKARLSEASAALAFSSVGASRRIEALQVAPARSRTRAIVRVEVRDQVLELALVADQRAGRPRGALEQAREVAVGLGAEQRLVDLGAALERGGRVLVGVVEGLGGRLAARRGVGVAVVAALGLAFRPLRELVEQVAQVLARVALQRGQHLVELHRRRRLRDLDRVAVVEHRRRRRARREVDEEVALEEDARPDLGGRVLVDRQRRGPRSRSVTTASFVPSLGSTTLTLPTLTPAMRTGEFDAQRVGRLEHGLDAERRA